MTADELTDTLAKINKLETESADTRASVHEAIEQARKLNDATRAGQSKLRAIDAAVAPLKAAVAAHREAESIARKKAADEKFRIEAAAKAEAERLAAIERAKVTAPRIAAGEKE